MSLLHQSEQIVPMLVESFKWPLFRDNCASILGIPFFFNPNKRSLPALKMTSKKAQANILCSGSSSHEPNTSVWANFPYGRGVPQVATSLGKCALPLGISLLFFFVFHFICPLLASVFNFFVHSHLTPTNNYNQLQNWQAVKPIIFFSGLSLYEPMEDLVSRWSEQVCPYAHDVAQVVLLSS